MKTWPDPTLNSAARTELEAATGLSLSPKQYDYLLKLDMTTQPVSRITMLYDLVFNTADTVFLTFHHQRTLEPCSRFLLPLVQGIFSFPD